MHAGSITINNRISLEGVVTELEGGALLVENPDHSIISAEINGIRYNATKILVNGRTITVDDKILDDKARDGVTLSSH